MSLYVVMKPRARVRWAVIHSVVSLMAFVPLIRTGLMARLCAIASVWRPSPHPAPSRGLDDDVVGSFQAPNSHFQAIRSNSSLSTPAMTHGWLSRNERPSPVLGQSVRE
jgi:hypothetical protein